VLLSLLALLALPTLLSAQQPGRILGRVVDQQTDLGVAGAQVFLPGLNRGTVTGAEGRFSLTDIPSGTHEVGVAMLGYADAVSPIEVRAGAATTLAIMIEPQVIELEGLTVEGRREGGSQVALQSQRRESAVVADAIGAEQISRSADGDAAAVVARSPGVSVVSGKYVYVRGLGERYGNATLNGAPLASPEPDRKVVPLDLIPSGFLESVVTAKTYSPDQPGDYAGGLVQIRTRSYPTQPLFRISGSLGYDSEATFAAGLTAPGGDLDFLGFDDGTRDLPAAIRRDVPVSPSVYSPNDLELLGESFSDTFGGTAEELPISGSASVVAGNRWLLGYDERPLGVLATLNYSNGWDNRPNELERVVSAQSLSGADDFEADYVGHRTTHSVNAGGMFQASFEPTGNHGFTASAVYNRIADDEARVLEGYNFDAQDTLRAHRLRYVGQDLLSGQLRGEHTLEALNDVRVDWRADVRTASRYEPNTRDLLYRRVGSEYLWENFVQSGSILHQDLEEFGWGGALDVSVPLSLIDRPATVRIGGSADIRDREVYTRRFRYLQRGTVGTGVRSLGPNRIFADANIRPADGFEIAEATFPGDNYRAEQSIFAGYGRVDFEPVSRLRILTGARVETTDQQVDPIDLFGSSGFQLESASLDNTDVLPALNVTYLLSDAMNVRLGVSRTLARPQFRELAPFQYADYAGGYLTVGNSLLERTAIRNYDLRWEWFPSLDATVAVSGFYKVFDQPIEQVLFTANESVQSWINASQATNYGGELEIRTGLGFIGDPLRTLSVNGNFTLVESDVDMPETATIAPGGTQVTASFADEDRPLQGQSPYVVNLGLTYLQPDWGTTVSALYNRFGERISSIGAGGLPNIHEEARGVLDIVLLQPLADAWSLKLSAENVLDDDVEFTQGDQLLRRYAPGTSVSLGISWGVGAD